MPCARVDVRAVAENEPVALLGVVDLAESHDVAGPPAFVKHLVARRQRAHCFPALRGENRRIQRQLFSGLLANFHERGVELPVAVGLDHAEQVADDLLLPVEQQKRLARPHALGMLERLNEIDRVVGAVFVIMRGRQHEARGLKLLTSRHACGLRPCKRDFPQRPPFPWAQKMAPFGACVCAAALSSALRTVPCERR